MTLQPPKCLSEPVSRRDAIQALGAALGGAALSLSNSPLGAGAVESPGIIDAHIHLVESRFPRARGNPTSIRLAPFDDVNEPNERQRLADYVSRQMRDARIEQALCMPSIDVSDSDPLGIRETLAVAALVNGVKLHPVGLIHPERFDRGHLSLVEKLLESSSVKALKAYLGYLPYEPDGPGYRPYYRLAAKYKAPVILHTGDTWSRQAKVKYAHPLPVDAIAVDHPDVRFVVAHFGNPWVMDAAEVIYKNDNVWADLSAFLVGSRDDFQRMKREGLMANEVQRISNALQWSESNEKLMFGSDWPLCHFPDYIEFVAKIVPAPHHAAVFSENAQKLFGL